MYPDLNIILNFLGNKKLIKLTPSRSDNLFPLLEQYTNQPDIFYTLQNKIITPDITISNVIKQYANSKFIDIYAFPKQKGGGLVGMFDSIITIGEFFLKIPDIIVWFGKLVAWFAYFVKWLFTDLLNPLKLGREFVNSLFSTMIAILRLPLDLFMAFIGGCFNTVGMWVQTIWGWDQANLTPKDLKSDYYKNNKCNSRKCYLTKKDKIPFSVILGTILCPPLGVFMEYGLTGWLNILVCMVLTLMFYVPGLMYALLILYS